MSRFGFWPRCLLLDRARGLLTAIPAITMCLGLRSIYNLMFSFPDAKGVRPIKCSRAADTSSPRFCSSKPHSISHYDSMSEADRDPSRVCFSAFLPKTPYIRTLFMAVPNGGDCFEAGVVLIFLVSPLCDVTILQHFPFFYFDSLIPFGSASSRHHNSWTPSPIRLRPQICTMALFY